MFDEQDSDRLLVRLGIAPPMADIEAGWSALIDEVLREATLERPARVPYRWFGRRGVHSEHLGYLLADMQYLQRTYPDARW
jgi:ring-1,2-phenylacetyl-CoA epoxidase subunit PaaC